MLKFATKQLILFLLLITALLSSCSHGGYNRAAEGLAKMYKATKCTVVRGSDLYTSNQLIVVIEEIGGVVPNYGNQKIASSCAKYLFNTLSVADLEGVNEVKVDVYHGGKKASLIYKVSDLKVLDHLVQPALGFYNYCAGKQFDKLRDLIDTNFVPAKNIDDITYAMYKIDSLFGDQVKGNITGFNFATTKETNVQILQIWGELQNGDSFTDLSFVINRESLKIIYVGINE